MRVPIERAIAWVLSGFVVGVAGALYGHYFVTFGPDDFYFNQRAQHRPAPDRHARRRRDDERHRRRGRLLLRHRSIYEVFRRWEVNGLGGVTPPSGTANFVLAVVLLVTLVLRPTGITGGREVPWPGDWRLDVAPAARRRRPGLGGGADAVQPREYAEVTSVMRATIWRQPDDLRGAARRPGARRAAGGAARRAAPRRRRHRHELARRQPRRLAAPRGRRRGRGRSRRWTRRLYGLPAREERRRPRAEPPEHEALLDRGARTGARLPAPCPSS